MNVKNISLGVLMLGCLLWSIWQIFQAVPLEMMTTIMSRSVSLMAVLFMPVAVLIGGYLVGCFTARRNRVIVGYLSGIIPFLIIVAIDMINSHFMFVHDVNTWSIIYVSTGITLVTSVWVYIHFRKISKKR